MSVLYITEQGACVSKKGERIIVEKEGKELLEIECFKLDTLLLFGNVQFTTQAARQLLKHGIEMAMLTVNGKLEGQLTPATPKNVLLRIAQVKAMDDPVFLLDMSKTIVSAKIANSLVLLQEFQRNHPEAPVKEGIEALRKRAVEVGDAAEPATLLGIEGNAASTYWKAYSLMCRGDLSFETRQKRPPKDPVNSLLSFGYSLVFARLQGLLDGVGLDPYIGFFHQPVYGRPSLAADLLEEFRSPLVDRFTLTLVNRRMLNPDHFALHEESGGMRLTREGMRKYFVKLEDYLGKSLAAFDDPSLDFNGLFKRQIQRLAKAIADHGAYVPFRVQLR